MKRLFTVISVLSLGLGLAACSNQNDSPFETALGSLGGVQDEERFAITFHDVAGIRETVGYEGDGTEKSEPGNTDPSVAWGLAATRQAVPMSLNRPNLPPVLNGPTMAWSLDYFGRAAIVHDTPDAKTAEDALTEAGWSADGDLWHTDEHPGWQKFGMRITDTDIQVLPKDGSITVEPDAERSALDDSRVQALLKCLDNPHMMVLVSTPNRDFTTALAVKVDSDGTAEAWSCIHAPGQAEELAATIKPNSPDVQAATPEVDGDVIRTELEVSSDSRAAPPEAMMIARAPEMPFPGF
ncbi:hypothetical protein [Enemella sp. A6]|uniref:hypothetical protein n=1 Tax=Enemella sp. A6 TaxID=3440152 RepID=UPI003EC0052C